MSVRTAGEDERENARRDAPVVVSIVPNWRASRARQVLLSPMDLHFFRCIKGTWRNYGEWLARHRAPGGCVTQIHDDVVAGTVALSPQFYCAYRSIQATRISPGARLEILRCSTFTTANPRLPLSHLFADDAAAAVRHLAAASSSACSSFSSDSLRPPLAVKFNPRSRLSR